MYITMKKYITCLTMFSCESLHAMTHIAVLLVIGYALSIVLARPAATWRLKRKTRSYDAAAEKCRPNLLEIVPLRSRTEFGAKAA